MEKRLDRVAALENAMQQMQERQEALEHARQEQEAINAELRARLDHLAPALSPAPRWQRPTATLLGLAVLALTVLCAQRAYAAVLVPNALIRSFSLAPNALIDAAENRHVELISMAEHRQPMQGRRAIVVAHPGNPRDLRPDGGATWLKSPAEVLAALKAADEIRLYHGRRVAGAPLAVLSARNHPEMFHLLRRGVRFPPEPGHLMLGAGERMVIRSKGKALLTGYAMDGHILGGPERWGVVPAAFRDWVRGLAPPLK